MPDFLETRSKAEKKQLEKLDYFFTMAYDALKRRDYQPALELAQRGLKLADDPLNPYIKEFQSIIRNVQKIHKASNSESMTRQENDYLLYEEEESLSDEELDEKLYKLHGVTPKKSKKIQKSLLKKNLDNNLKEKKLSIPEISASIKKAALERIIQQFSEKGYAI